MSLSKLLSCALLLSSSLGLVNFAYAASATTAGGLNAKLLDKADIQDNAQQGVQINPKQELQK